MNIFRRLIIYALPDKLREIIRYWLQSIPAFFYQNNLSKLAKRYGTDKYDHGYTVIYQAIFEPIRHQKLRILEIGVGGGAHVKFGGNSLKMWAKFFTKSEILGIDIYDKSFLNYRRIQTFQGNQSDVKFLSQFSDIDIVIDDGSHINSDIIQSFEFLYPRLNNGGFYCIEDTQVSGSASYTESTYQNTVDYFQNYIDKSIASKEFYGKLIIIHKK